MSIIREINFDGLMTWVFRVIIMGLVSKELVKLEKQYIQPFYQNSDLWNREQYAFYSWHQLDDDLEYSFHRSTSNDKMPSRIVIKNVGTSEIEEISIHIIAERCFDGIFRGVFPDCQECLKLINLSPGSVVEQYLTNIPPFRIWFEEETKLSIQSCDEIYVHLLSKKKNGIPQNSDVKKRVECFDRLDSSEKNAWESRWGKTYNVILLNDWKQQFEDCIRAFLSYHYVGSWPQKSRKIPRARVYYEDIALYGLKFNLLERFLIFLKQKVDSIIAVCLLNKISVNALFWIYVLFGKLLPSFRNQNKFLRSNREVLYYPDLVDEDSSM